MEGGEMLGEHNGIMRPLHRTVIEEDSRYDW